MEQAWTQRWSTGQEAADRATAIRAQCLASGLTAEATERLGESKNDEAGAPYGCALAILDPPHPILEDLRNKSQTTDRL